MRIFRRKTKHPLVAIFILLIIVGAGGFFFFHNIKKAAAEWYDSNWFYRQAVTVTVTSSSSDVSNLDTWFTMNTSALISANKLQSGCQDLRFTNANGKLLPYFIDSGCNTTTTKIWVRIDLVPKNSTTYTLYTYYGNPSASPASDSNKFNLYNGLVGYWNMNEASWTNNCSTLSIKDFSVNGSNGKSCPNGTGPLGGASGKYGKAGSFDGTSNYIDVGGAGTYDFGGTQPFSLAAWVNPTVSSGGGDVISKYNGGVSGEYILTVDYDGTVVFHRDVSPWELVTGPVVMFGQWNHIVANYDGSTMRIYVNGVLAGSMLSGSENTDTVTSVKIGAEFTSGSPASYFPGYIDDVRIYNRALSASEVSQLYSDNSSSILTAVQGQSVPSVSFAAEEVGPGPVAYWKFDEGQGQTAYDSSSNKNNGTLGNSTGIDAYDPTWVTNDQCVSGKCLKFDGSASFVDPGTGSSLNITNAITVEAWVNPVKLAGMDPNQMVIYNRGVNAANYQGVMVGLAGNNLWFEIGNGTVYRSITSSSSYNTNKFQHVVYTWDGSTMKMYLNGVRDSVTGSITGSINYYVTTARIGAEHWGYNARVFNGFIDDVKIFPYARTAAQIQADYNARGSNFGISAQVGGQSSWMTNGLVGYWKMDEASWNGTAGEVIDSSGAGNNGTSAGAIASPSAKFGNSGYFNGGSYINLGNNPSLSTTTSFTWTWWQKKIAVLPGHEYPIGYDATGSSTWIDANSGTQRGFQYNSPTTGYHDLSFTYTEPLNTWEYISVTFDNGLVKQYINGVLQKQDNLGPDSLYALNDKLIIGGLWNGGGYFYGNIDEVRIYNRALSPKEVSDLYNWAPGPVGWWKMDDKVSGNSQTIIDSSGYGNNVTTYGTGMNCKVIGKYGGGCLFNGIDDYASIADNANLRVGETSGSGATYEAWFKLSIIPTVSGIIMKKNGLTPYLATNREIRTDVNYHSASPWFAGSGIYATVGTWYFVSVTHDGQTTRFYVNGVLITSNTANDYLPSSVTNAFYVGKQFSGSYFPGTIDDVRVYNYARTSKQIMEDMNAGHPSVGSPVGSYAAYWKFDEGYGNTVHDMSVNANTGTIYGASWTNDGKFGKALVFDGSVVSNDYVSFPNNIITSTEFTISAWAKMNGPSGGSGDNAIFEQRDDTMGDNHSAITLEADNPLQLDFGVRSSVGTEQDISAPHPSSYGQWHHYVGVVSSTTISLYIDGVLISSVANNQTGNYTTSISYRDIGRARYGGYTSGIFNGTIDEVKVYNFALTADDIKVEYNRGALKMGSVSDTSGLGGGSVASNSASAAYCVPGDTASCAGPVGEWKFDENVSGNSQTLYDTSGNGNNAITSGNLNCKALGAHATGCQFDGTDYTSVTNNSILDGAKTFEFWAKIPTFVGNPLGILSKMNGSGGYAIWAINDAGSPSHYHLRAGFNATLITFDTSNIDPYLNKWTHYAVTVTNSGCSLYINGVLIQTNGAFTGTPTSNTAPLYMGQDYWWTGMFFQGSLDEVRIFNYARTPAQIAWDYNRGKPVGWWKFDECQGTTANDSSGNGNTGAISIGGSGTQTTVGTCLTPTNGSGAWYNGKVGKYNSALSLDGNDDYVNAGTGSSLNNLTAATWEAWINLNTQSQGFFMYKSDNGGAAGWYMGIRTGYGIGINVVWSGSQDLVRYTSSLPSTGSWFHFAATWSSGSAASSVHVYINGKEINYTLSTDGNGSHSDDSSQPFYIGYGGSVPGGNLNGLIDDVKVYNYPLTPAQIKLDYNQGAAVRFGPITGTP